MKNLFSLAAVFFLSCFLTQDLARSESIVSGKKTEKLRLGIIVPLSGPLAFFGQDYVRAFELAAEDQPEINDLIQVIWEDSAYDSKQAVSAFNKLVTIDHVDAVWSFGGPMLHALAPIAEAKQIPFFATESAKKDCEGKDFCSLFRNEEDEWGKATWKALRNRNLKKIGIVKNQNQFMNTFVDAIVRTKAGDETVEVLVDVPPETVDLRAIVPSLRAKKVDALGVYLLPASHRGLVTALRDANISIQMFGVEEFLEMENNKSVEKLINGTLVIAPGATDTYRSKFEQRYGHSAGFYYTPAFYDFLILLKDTIASNRALRGIDLVKVLRFPGKRSGVSGTFSAKVSDSGVHSYSFPIFIYKVTSHGVVVDQVIRF